MSYKKAAELLHLAVELSSSHLGLTLAEIDSRSTAQGASARRNTQRLLDAVREVFGDKLIETLDYEGRKRVRLERGKLRELVHLEAGELASLDHAISALRAQNDHADASRLEELRTKVRLMAPERSRRKIETDYEALLGASSLMVRPGPRPSVEAKVMEPITEAILALKKLAFKYGSGPKGDVERLVSPYGVLTGHRVYLVAQLNGHEWGDPPVWRVDRMRDLRVTDEASNVPGDFDLEAFSRRSFGAFHSAEEYGEVIWRFTPKAADRARSFHFHPDQELKDEEDGSLIVRFSASGHLEMAWFLYAWGDQVEVVAPLALRNMVQGYQRNDFPGMP
ncbi:helix-turn-helix transcriptional regulator [Devosia sp. RR2S18]|uniref:helix-turn-helix transcriptional regulator n=1 Tax=Devosia rhizosphaerae TaxID=3049774 RepID=UPI0025417F5D|nr:WYL domain-containing protein [Devosia sp. RR2S18]WIJ25789.1 WYL domain-containing protein [Devosia sp. RR2S18]